ncbi:sugar phosphate isomerase/epimerase [bacterium]|nr:MAG: sugar phosphate isomerase/epimerase [bacterium]
MFKTCLNTSTISGYKLSLSDEIEIVARAGYDAIEPWISELEAHENAGGKLEDLGQKAKDLGISFQGAIGFFDWIVDDDAQRAAALETARRDMDKVARVGGSLIAAPPMGAVETSGLDLFRAAERYSALCDLGAEFGVRPLVEVWGFSKTLSRLGEAAFVAIESGHPNAGILADVYHLYKGGSPNNGLSLLNGKQLPIFHVNDYPAGFTPDKIVDADRVYPGDGVAPLRDVLDLLEGIGFDGYLSVELFNPEYWKSDAFDTARTALEKLKGVLAPANS